MVNHSLLNDLPEDVVNSVMKGADKEMKMPPGYNPSDDSEDDYKPGPKKGRRKDDSDIDSEEESRAKKPRRTPGRKPKYSSPQISSTPRPSTNPSTPSSAPRIKPEPGQEETEACILCQKKVSVHRDARFHYSVHFYDENAFLSMLKPEDLLENGKAQDETGRVYKYTCPHEGCTKRKMGYKEMCVHLATAHQQLRQLMKEDKRPGMKEVLNRLYPEEPTFSTVKVKQEKGVTSTLPVVTTVRQELDNSEDVDDPTEPDTSSKPSIASKHNKAAPAARRPAVQVKQQPVKTKMEVKSEGSSLAPRVDKIHNCLVCNGPGRTSKDGRNLNLGSGLQELKYHYSVCVYNEGGLMPFVDPGQGGVKYEDLELYGNKFRYKCPFVNCTKNQGRNKAIGYKEYAIHCGVAHHQIERWMEQEEDNRVGLKEVFQAIKAARERDGLELEDMPNVVVEEMHTCLICRGEDKEGKNLSFDGSKIYQTRYHYAACYYEEGAYKAKYPPGPQNTKEDGEPKDILGKEIKYSCQERGCTVKRKMGYKEFTIHMSNEHGGLEEVMIKDHREEVRALADKIQK